MVKLIELLVAIMVLKEYRDMVYENRPKTFMLGQNGFSRSSYILHNSINIFIDPHLSYLP